MKKCWNCQWILNSSNLKKKIKKKSKKCIIWFYSLTNKLLNNKKKNPQFFQIFILILESVLNLLQHVWSMKSPGKQYWWSVIGIYFSRQFVYTIYITSYPFLCWHSKYYRKPNWTKPTIIYQNLAIQKLYCPTNLIGWLR